MAHCLICGAELSRSVDRCRACGTVQPRRRIGGAIALAVLVAGLVLAALVAILL